MEKNRNQKSGDHALRKFLNSCPNCGAPLLMFGCNNPRCENYYGNKCFFYHEIIMTQVELDKEFKEKERKDETE